MFRPDPTKRPTIFTIRANRYMVKVVALAIAAQFVVGSVFGWTLASLIICAAVVGHHYGHLRGYKHGMDFQYAIFLRAQLQTIVLAEDALAEHFTPDSEARREVAKTRGEIIEELRRVA